MKRVGLWAILGLVPVWAGEMPPKAAEYHAALVKRPESGALFDRFRDAWLEERTAEELEEELAERAAAGDAGAWAILGRARRMAGREEAALEAFAKAREISPAVWLDLEMAKLRLAAKDFAGAEQAALAVPEGHKDRGEALKLAGLACLRSERVEEALAHWALAVASAPEDKGLLEDLTELTRKEGRLDLALDFCGKWRDASDDPYAKAMATLRRADLLLGSQRFDEAMEDLSTVLKASGDGSWLESETIARAEEAHRRRGDSRAWAAWIEGKADEHPSRLNFRRVQAQALAATGQHDEALEILSEVLKRSPGDAAARWQRVDLLARASKVEAAFEESKVLAGEEKSEFAALRWAELAFQLEKKDEVKQALDAAMAAAAPARRVGLAGHYARYGLPAESERIWRELALGEDAAQSLRELGKHLRLNGRDKEAVAAWKQLGARDVAGDRIEAAQLLAAAGEMDAAREVLVSGRAKFSQHPGYEAALAELALVEKKPEEAGGIYLSLARAAQRPDELASAIKGWLRSVVDMEDPSRNLGDSTPDRCLRAAWLASRDQELPAVVPGDELERTVRLGLLREHGKWADAVALMESADTKRGPLFFSELADAKSAAGDLPGTLAAARAWREAAPDQPGPWLREADALEKSGLSKDALLLLRRAASRFEDNEEIARKLFTQLQLAASPDDALTWAWKRHDRTEDSSLRAGWFQEILRASKAANQLDDLQERLEERARRDPASPGPLKALAELAKTRNDSREELDLLRRAAVNAPRDVSLVSAIATLEERNGDTGRALERYLTLARLAPGPDSARQLAHARIRLGEIEAGVRDLQSMAGEKGLDLRSLEQWAGDLASRGFVEEAIRLVHAVEAPRRDARLHFVLGCLLQMDGRETEAAEAFATVLAEPDDPVENQPGYDFRSSDREYRSVANVCSKLASASTNRPNGFQRSDYLQVPESLANAKYVARERIAILGYRKGGELWSRAVSLVPEFAGTRREDWQELLGSGLGMNFQVNTSLEFFEKYPRNPLGLRLFVEQGLHSELPEGKLEALLDREPSLPVELEMKLRLGHSSGALDNVAFLESLTPADWENNEIRRQAFHVLDRTIYGAGRPQMKPPVPLEAAVRAFALMEKAAKPDLEAKRLPTFAARIALLENRADDFVRHLNALEPPADVRGGHQDYYGSYSYLPSDLFEAWSKKHGQKATDALMARITSPLVRCQLSIGKPPALRLKQVDKELSALPADAPIEIRRGLVRLKQSCFTDDLAGGLRKYLEEIVAEASDPRLVLEARMSLGRYERDQSGREANRALIEPLVRQLLASNDESDRLYAARFEGYLNSGRVLQVSLPPPPNRWGPAASYNRQSSFRSEQELAAILDMEDRALAARAAARLLEITARSSSESERSVASIAEKLRPSKLLDQALALISGPSRFGLTRRLAMVRLFDGCGKPETARQWLAQLAEDRPDEIDWTLQLALRSTDDDEMARLLDSVSERPDFDATLAVLAISTRQEKPEVVVPRLNRLATWAEQSPRPHAWLASPLLAMSTGQNGVPKVSATPSPQLDCFRRLLALSENQAPLAEIAFRARQESQIDAEDAAVLAVAARTALLSGAYRSTERQLLHASIFRNDSIYLPDGPSALEHLVSVARSSGDEASFPPDFLSRLRDVDPATSEWIAALLAANNASSLPGIADFSLLAYRAWPERARHDAAVLRAATVKGSEKWLQQTLRDGEPSQLSKNVREVIREILLEARRKRSLAGKIISLLEAATGPRKDWNKPPAKGGLADESGRFSDTDYKRGQLATLFLNSVGTCESSVMLDVIRAYREANIAPAETSSAIHALGRAWRAESMAPKNAKLAELIGGPASDAFLIGFWSKPRQVQPASKLEFVWILPQVLQGVNLTPRDELLKNIINHPDAPLIDHLHAWVMTGQADLSKRLLTKAAPSLTKLPEAIRSTVLDTLARGIDDADSADLPPLVTKHLRARSEMRRAQQIQQARNNLEYCKNESSPSQSPVDLADRLGGIAGSILDQDEKLLAEVLTMVEPLAAADRSGAVSLRFSNALINHSTGDPRGPLLALRLLDSFWQKHPLPVVKAGSADLLARIYQNIHSKVFWRPTTWQEIARLSPSTLAGLFSQLSITQRSKRDPSLDEKLRAAAKASPIALAALEWILESETARADRKHAIDQDKLMALLSELKGAGVVPEQLEEMLCRQTQLERMQNPAAWMAAIPGLLDGVKTLSSQHFDFLLQQVRQISQVRRSSAENKAEDRGATTVFLKFIAAKRPAKSRNDSNYLDGMIMPLVLATGDDELIQLWVKNAGKSLLGNLPLIIYLLERDQIPQAIQLVPVKDDLISDSSMVFDAKMESLVAKLRRDPSPQAFRLALLLSLDSSIRDVRSGSSDNAEKPSESRDERSKRLFAEFSARSNEFSAAERQSLILFFHQRGFSFHESSHILAEFADENSARAFRRSLFGEGTSPASQLFLPAVCSLAHGGDLSGMERLAAILSHLDEDKARSSRLEPFPYLIGPALIAYADRQDAKLSPAASETYLQLGRSIAKRKSHPIFMALASYLIHLGARDAATLQRELKEAELEQVKPFLNARYFQQEASGLRNFTAALRVAILHPVSSAVLMDPEVFGVNGFARAEGHALLRLLGDPALRAKLAPALYCSLTRHLSDPQLTVEEFQNMKIYAEERRADFTPEEASIVEQQFRMLSTYPRFRTPAAPKPGP